jgi:ankyrin repeat protein
VPPLIVAFEKRDTTPAMTREIMLKLLDTGADIEIRWGGDTPLIAAARANNLTAFSLLLDKGANKNVKSDEGDTLWDIVMAPEIHPSIFYRLMGYKGPEL